MKNQLPDELQHALRSIEPPPGGLTRLRAAIEEDTRRRHSRIRWWFAVAPVAAVIALVLWSRRGGDDVVVLPAHESAPVAVPDLSISPTFYWVGSSERPAQRASVSYVDVRSMTPVSQLHLP